MVRVGVSFESMLPEEKLRLDRFIFGRLRTEARSKRHLKGMISTDTPHEKRQARRIQAQADPDLELRMARGAGRNLPLALQAQLLAGHGGSDPAQVSQRLCDLSVSGCAFLCSAQEAPRPGAHVELELRCGRLWLHLQGLVVYVTEEGAG
jgi:hypothetical protein